MKRSGWLHLPRRPGPSFMQLWRARHISVIRIAERERRAERRQQAVSLRWSRPAVVAALPVALVAAIAGVVSYSHITALGMRTHQGAVDSHLLAIPVDGLIVAGSVILAAGSALGWLGIALGVAATLFANLQFGLAFGALSAAVSTWPAIAFSVASFMLERWLRSQAGRGGQDAAHFDQQAPADSLDAAIQAMLATSAAGNPLSGRQLESRFGLKRPAAAKVRQLVLAEANGHAPRIEDEPNPDTTQ